MSPYKVEICGVNTSKLPILSDDEKDELFVKIKARQRKIYSGESASCLICNQALPQ